MVGGWGHGFFDGSPDGTTSGTTDGGATWFNANDVGRFINRFRFLKSSPIVGYASGGTVYQCVASDDAGAALLTAALIRGGWIIPGEPDRSMFLVAIIGTGRMQSVLSAADVQLLSDWVTAGAVIPAAEA